MNATTGTHVHMMVTGKKGLPDKTIVDKQEFTAHTYHTLNTIV